MVKRLPNSYIVLFYFFLTLWLPDIDSQSMHLLYLPNINEATDDFCVCGRMKVGA